MTASKSNLNKVQNTIVISLYITVKEQFHQILDMEEEFKYGATDQDMKVIGKMIKPTSWED